MLLNVSSMSCKIQIVGESSVGINHHYEIRDIMFRMRLMVALETVTCSEKDQDRQEGI